MQTSVEKSLIIIIFTLFLTGCSAKLVYNYADWLIFWKIGDYVELNSEQKKVLENKVEELQNWHRTEELPYYSALLKQLRNIVENRDEKELAALFLQGPMIWQRSITKLSPEIIEFLTLLSTSQKQELITNIGSIQQETNEKWLKEIEDGNQQRIEDAEQRIEDYVGKLTKKQKETLVIYEQQRPNIIPLRIEGRKRWLTLFSKAILQDPEIDKTLVEKLLTDLSSHRSIKQQALTEQITQLNLSKFRYLLKSMTDKQQSKLLIKIDDITKDIDQLSKQI
ncbi:hypothetical protein KO505_00750 [Psychrosphaera sp. F3M07]|uniref:DUF6279 family lipoprotein n=1 Tax=Psychrosphaera sp. F3M07 TaxID=2841560 RepID=UPI001C08B6E1|nr:DUF6279 family lipoprotein [Psychrosphaera sp. F3M07]MBU2916485.1 hypothetical protein [Psychrosphaera sp. F3M07]